MRDALKCAQGGAPQTKSDSLAGLICLMPGLSLPKEPRVPSLHVEVKSSWVVVELKSTWVVVELDVGRSRRVVWWWLSRVGWQVA